MLQLILWGPKSLKKNIVTVWNCVEYTFFFNLEKLLVPIIIPNLLLSLLRILKCKYVIVCTAACLELWPTFKLF